MGQLTGKTALVTGGSRGIGRAIALRLGAEGARVAVHYGGNEAAAKETVALIEAAGGSAFALRTELGVPGDAEALWRAFDAHADGVDILVNNAGVAGPGLIHEVTEAEYDRVFAVNAKAPFFIIQHGLDRLRDGGRIINISSGVTRVAFPGMMVPRAEVCAERIEEVLGTETSVVPPAAPVTELRRTGHLEVRGAGFRYPGAEEPVLRDVDLVARPGETTAIIGSTGSGKSTLLGLVPRLFDATDGEVLVDGVDVAELDPALMARTVGLVPQKPYLFSGTVATNLRYGNPDASDEELWHALEVAQAADFVRGLEHGLDAPIAQGGTNVSGGQRQRLAIARTLVQRPEIYLFDDSFSALDYTTDALLRTALARETAESTVVIVAQRVSTIRDADRIVVLDEGRVVGTGRHHELMAGNETYREIVLSQLTEAEAA